jgi:hypothetical protein
MLFFLAHSVGKDTLLHALNAFPPTCPTRIFFGIKCAFCGMTHALIHFVFFDWKAAFFENALAIPLFVLISAWIVLMSVRPERFNSPRLSALPAGIGIGILMAYSILRNLPF